MRRAYKFLLRPTSKQADALAECLEDTRQLYNAALEERREAWRMARKAVRVLDQAAQLKDIRAADPERYARWAFTCERAALRRLDRAFAAFFRRLKAGEKPGYPRYRGPGRFDSAEWEHKHGCHWKAGDQRAPSRIYLQGIGDVRVHQHRAVEGRIKMVAVKREGDRWYVVLSCDDVPARQLPATGAVVGIDLGVTHLLTTSDGAHVPNPRHLEAVAARVATADRSLARKKRGSKRRQRAVTRGAKIKRKVRRSRLDYAHKTALKLVRDHDVIVHEDLKITNMVRRPKPRPAGDGTYEPNGAAAKSGLNRSISDAGWRVFLDVLRAKAESAGRVVIEVDARNTSRTCSKCGHCAKGNRVSQSKFRCLSCGHEAHADVQAAGNILRAGLALQAADNAA